MHQFRKMWNQIYTGYKERSADDPAIICKTQDLEDMMNRFFDNGGKCGMEINIEKSQVMRISKINESLWIKVGNRELKEVDHFKYFWSVLTRDGYCTRERKMRIAMGKK